MMQKGCVDVSLCKSNIRGKSNTYYGRVCNKGHISSEELLDRFQKIYPYLDVNVTQCAMMCLTKLIGELVASGNDVDFFSLGTFSLECAGRLDVACDYVEDGYEENRIEYKNADADVSKAVLTKPHFCMKFAPSPFTRKLCKNVEAARFIKKLHAPVIAQLECIAPKDEGEGADVQVLKITGENLKIAGEKEEIGVYIMEENCEKKGSVARVEQKIPMQNIIKNTPSELLLMLDGSFKKEKKYTFKLLTQYVKMGRKRVGQLLRGVEVDFYASNRVRERRRDEGLLQEFKRHSFKLRCCKEYTASLASPFKCWNNFNRVLG